MKKKKKVDSWFDLSIELGSPVEPILQFIYS